jgi:phosphotriesterase-related protein
MTPDVNTVLGPRPVGALGRVLMHEHTVIRWPGAEADYRPLPLTAASDPAAEYAAVVAQLRRAKAAGISTIVDAAPADLGRNVDVDRRAAAETGVNILVVTGQYSCYRMPWYDPTAMRWIATTADDLASNFVREIEQGIGDTGIRAGLIKVATPEGVVDAYSERALRAAARAHLQTGAPIITHTENGTLGREQVEIFASEGADLSRVVIGHNDTGDLAYLLDILDSGANLGYDRFGYENFLPERIRFGALLALLQLGFEKQIVLSHDLIPAVATRVDLAYVPDTIVPRLLDAGVPESAIDVMLVRNPRRIISGLADDDDAEPAHAGGSTIPAA